MTAPLLLQYLLRVLGTSICQYYAELYARQDELVALERRSNFETNRLT